MQVWQNYCFLKDTAVNILMFWKIICYALKNLEIVSGMRKRHWSFSALDNTTITRWQKMSVSSKLIEKNLFWHSCWLQCSTYYRNARGLYWFKLGMDKLVGVTGSCQTHRHCTCLKVLESCKRALKKPHTCLLSSSTFPSPSALGYWDWATGQAPVWPDLGCSACTLEESCFSSGLHRVPWHPAPGYLMASQLLFPHLPPQ